MLNPFVCQISLFAFNFAPAGWATCEGQLLPISQNTALYMLRRVSLRPSAKTHAAARALSISSMKRLKWCSASCGPGAASG